MRRKKKYSDVSPFTYLFSVTLLVTRQVMSQRDTAVNQVAVTVSLTHSLTHSSQSLTVSAEKEYY